MNWKQIMSHSLVFLLGVLCVLYFETKSPIPAKVEPRVVYKIKAFCPKSCCCGRFADGITASGYKIQPGDKIIAAPSFIPFGTMVDIPGYGEASVQDRGRLIMSNTLEVYFDTHQEAVDWGVKYPAVRFWDANE